MLPERAYRVNLLALATSAAVGLSACRTGWQDGIFSKSGVRYELGRAPSGFTPVGFQDNDVAFEMRSTGHSIAVNSTCHGYEDASLQVLRRHLLMGFTDVELLEEEVQPLDGRDSLWTHVAARLDGVPLQLQLVVLKKNGCVFDFTYVSPPAEYAARRADFQGVVGGFHLKEPGGP
jgi:hypothetical protein